MGTVRVETQTDGSLDNWIESMMGACGVTFMPEGAELPESSTIENEDVFYEVPLLDVDENTPADDKLKVFGAELEKLHGKIEKVASLEETISDGPYYAAFQYAKDMFSKFVNEALRKHAELLETPPDHARIDELEGWISQSYTLYGDVEAAAHNATRSIDQLLTRLQTQSASLRNELEAQHSARAALAKAGVGVKNIDSAYATALKALESLNTAIKVSDFEASEEALGRARIWTREVVEAVRAADLEKEAQLAAILFKLSLVERDVSKLGENRSLVEGSKHRSEAFGAAFEAAQNTLSQARAAIKAADFVSADQLVAQAGEHQTSMQHMVLLNIVYPEQEDNAKAEDCFTGTGSSKEQIVFKETMDIRRQAESLHKDKEKIKASGGEGEQFEGAFNNVVMLTKNAQFDIINKRPEEAATKNTRAEHDLNSMTAIHKKMKVAEHAVAIQIEQLKNSARVVYALYPELQALAQGNDQYFIIYRRFSALMDVFTSAVEAGGGHVKSGYLVEANEEAKQAQKALDELLNYVRGFERAPGAPELGGAAGPLSREIAKSQADYNHLSTQSDNFQEEEELQAFERFSKRAKHFLSSADESIKQDDTEEARGYWKIAQVALDGMLSAFERGASISAKRALYTAAVEDYQSKIVKLYQRRNEIEDDKQAVDFLGYNSTANEILQEIETLLHAGQVRDVQALLIELPMHMFKMEACFDPSANSASAGNETSESLLKKIAELTQDLSSAEANWGSKLDDNSLSEFNATLQEAKQILAGAKKSVEENAEGESAGLNDLQQAWRNANQLYRQLLGMYRAALTRSVEDGDLEAPDPEVLDLTDILHDMERLRLKVEQAYLDWSPELTHEKISDMNAAYQSVLREFETVDSQVARHSSQASFIIPQLRTCLEDATLGLELMRKIFTTSEEIKTRLLGSLRERISLYQSKFDAGFAKLKEAVDWDVDLTAPDAAYNKGMAEIAKLETAIKNRDTSVTELYLSALEEDLEQMNAAIETALENLADLRSKYSRRVSQMIHRYSEICSRTSTLINDEATLKAFTKTSDLTSNLLKSAMKMIDVSTQADYDCHITYIENQLKTLENMLSKT